MIHIYIYYTLLHNPPETENEGVNEHGIAHRRGLTCQQVTPIPDLRSGLDSPTSSPLNKQPFQGLYIQKKN